MLAQGNQGIWNKARVLTAINTELKTFPLYVMQYVPDFYRERVQSSTTINVNYVSLGTRMILSAENLIVERLSSSGNAATGLNLVTYSAIDQYSATGLPQYYALAGSAGSNLMLSPTPNQTGILINIYGNLTPAAVSAETDTIPVPLGSEDMFITRVAMQLAKEGGDPFGIYRGLTADLNRLKTEWSTAMAPSINSIGKKSRRRGRAFSFGNVRNV